MSPHSELMEALACLEAVTKLIHGAPASVELNERIYVLTCAALSRLHTFRIGLATELQGRN